jgi:hypothetical protein
MSFMSPPVSFIYRLLIRICERKRCDEMGLKKDGEAFLECDWREQKKLQRGFSKIDPQKSDPISDARKNLLGK